MAFSVEIGFDYEMDFCMAESNVENYHEDRRYRGER
jgi:hypothetical protein